MPFKPPRVRLELLQGSNFRVVAKFTYTCWIRGVEHVTDVPQGFTCDLTSSPRLVRLFIPKLGGSNWPSVVHDWHYRTQNVPRRVADEIFMRANAEMGVPRWRQLVMHIGLRLGGWVAWNSNAEIYK